MRFGPFTKDWAGQTAIVIGNGPSLLEPGAPRPRPDEHYTKTLVANGGYKTFPDASVLMCSDRHWLAANPDLSGFFGPEIIVTRPEAIAREDPRMWVTKSLFIGRTHGDIFTDPGTLVEGHNSTSTNISLAVLRGASRIILLGVDLAPGKGNRRRIYDESQDDPAKAFIRYRKQVDHLTQQALWVLKRGIRVFNCSPKSALTCYPYAEFREVF